MNRQKKRKDAFLYLALAGLLCVAAPEAALAAETEGLTPEISARLEDNRIEYDEWFDLLKYKYGPIRSAYEQIESSIESSGTITLETSLLADDLMRQAQELEDSMSGLPQEEKAALRAQANGLKSQARSTRNTLFFSNQQMES